MSRSVNWKYIIRTCILIVTGVALFTGAGWFNGDKSFEEFVRRIRIRNQQYFLEDMKAGIPRTDMIDVEADGLLLERQRYSGLTTARCFAIVYAYKAFWIAVSIIAAYYGIRFALAVVALKREAKHRLQEPS